MNELQLEIVTSKATDSFNEDDLLLTKCCLHTLLTAMSSLVLVETSSGQDS